MRIAAAQLAPLHRTLLILLGLTWPGAAGLAAQRSFHQVRGVVTDTELAPVAGVEVLIAGGSRTATTDARGRFVLDSVPEGKVRLTVRRVGYLALHPTITVPQSPGDVLQVILLPFAQQLEPIQVDVPRRGISGVVGDRTRLVGVDLTRAGREYSIFMHELGRGRAEWADTRPASWALQDLSLRLASVLIRGTDHLGADLCAWSADQMDLIEWGGNACRAVGGVARALGNECGPQGALRGRQQSGFVILWPRG